MPRAKRREDYLDQVAGWLRDNYPTPFPVDLVWRRQLRPKGTKSEQYAVTYREGMRLYIELSSRALWPVAVAVETLIHEWAHCHSWQHSVLEWQRTHGGHDEIWGIAYAKIYSHFFDFNGYKEAREYPHGRRRRIK